MFTELKENWDKIIIIIIITMVGVSLLLKPVESGDEFWNYGFAKNICAGLSPYSDFSIVQTPLSAYVAALFLSLFGDSLIVHRIVGVILFVSTFFLIYLICEILAKSRLLAFTAVAFSIVLIYYAWIYNYNHLNLFVVLLISYLQIRKNHNTETFKPLILGSLLYGLTPLIKQSTGAVLLVFYWCFLIFLVLIKKEKIKRVFIHIGLSILPFISYLLIIFVSGDMKLFIDYAVVGIKTFTHRTWITSMMSANVIYFIIGFVPFIIIILSAIAIMRKTANVNVILFLYLLGLAVSAGVVAFPLCDFSHYMVATIGYIPCLFCCIRVKPCKIKYDLVCAVAAGAVLVSLVSTVVTDTSKYKKCELNNYEGLLISPTLEKSIFVIDDYILEKEKEGLQVIVADVWGSACMQPLDKYNKDFDMLLVGNLGTKSVEELLAQNENALYLVIRDEEFMGMQEHYELIHHVKKNYEKIDEVYKFDVYRSKE